MNGNRGSRVVTCNICTLPQPEQENDQHPSVGLLWCASFWYRTPVQAGWQPVVTPPMSHHFHRKRRTRIIRITTRTSAHRHHWEPRRSDDAYLLEAWAARQRCRHLGGRAAGLWESPPSVTSPATGSRCGAIERCVHTRHGSYTKESVFLLLSATPAV